MKINKLNESAEHPYMFQYNCNNPTFGYDFQRYAQELGARRMYDHTQKGGGLYFYTVPSEDVYNKLKEVSKKRFTVDMYQLRPFDKERFTNAKVQEAMTIAYSEDTIKRMISQLEKEIEDYKQLIIDEPEDKAYWEEEIKKCQDEISDLESYKPLDEASERPLYIIRDSHGNQLSAPNPDDEELWDRVSAMEARGKRGLCVVAYTEKMKEDFDAMNNKLVTDKPMNENKDTVPIHYDDIEFTHYGTQYDVDRWDETEVSTDWTYDVSKDDIVTFLIEEHGSELFEDEIPNEEMEKYILDNFDDLLYKYLDSIKEYFREEATEDAQDKWEPYNKEDYSESLDEAGQRYYVTTYTTDSVSGPEEGGYTSYGWRPTHSKYFPSIEDARKEMIARIEDDDEIISQDEDRIYVKDAYGDEYIVAVEPAAKRGRTEEPPRTWTQAEFDTTTPRTYFDKSGRALDHNPYAKKKAEKQKAALMKDFMSKLASCNTRDEVFDVYSNAPYQVQLEVVAEVAAKLKEIDGNLNEAHYGGAFDIEDDQYFTREEIDEFGYEIVDTLNTLGYNKFDYNGGYVDGNVLSIQIYWADGEVTVEQIIDMRKIRTPNDLSRKYLGVMVEKAKLELEKIGADFGPHLNGKDYPIDEDFGDEVIHLDLIPEPTLKASNVKFSHELAKELDDMFMNNKLWVQELHYNPVEDQIEFDINRGDWKHEHLRAKWLINDFFEDKNSWVKINSWTTEEDGSDNYSAHYEIYN